ncbi:MAG: hypothetical protein ABDI07_10910 [Candidatus Kryptonium sp.]
MKLHYYDGNAWRPLESYINSHANFVIVDNLTEREINENNSFVIFTPVDYHQRWNIIRTYTWNKLNRICIQLLK